MNKLLIYIQFILVVIISITLVIMLILTMGGYHLNKVEHYNNDNNYVTLNGPVEAIHISQEHKYISITVDNTRCRIDDYNFNDSLMENVSNNISVGDNVEITYGIGYFGDGWTYPIIELKYNDEIFLERSIGKENLVKYWIIRSKKSKKFYFSTISIVVSSFLGFRITMLFQKLIMGSFY